ncbi:HAD-like domain-containing protein [Multifurca ochricompacta]|uniref:HAD-like domain-containing protein n=1 Tax=Multifurca ochricompacta TaxID=376703 RepID=A0AAD4M5W6_9AGAM|nr:HAD-like domain-containing protein [Multifurca ochricompacta]
MSLAQFKVLIFDVYGTLVDWESGIYNSLTPLVTDLGHQWSNLRRTIATPLCSARRAGSERKHRCARRDLQGFRGSNIYDLFRGRIRCRVQQQDRLPCAGNRVRSLARPLADLPDTIAALAKLSSLGLKLTVLSNVDRASFSHTRAALERGFVFDAVYTAEEIGSYKPDPHNLQYAVTQLQADYPALEREQILVVAQSLPHDHVPARALGLSSVWIDRPDAVTCLDGDGVPKSRTAKETFAGWRFRSLEDFADAVEMAKTKPS